MSSTKKSYSNEFKSDAVKLASDIGRTKAANQLGIPVSNIHKWVRGSNLDEKQGLSNSSNPTIKELQQQIKKLERENSYIKKINDVLKKSTAIFSSDQGPRY